MSEPRYVKLNDKYEPLDVGKGVSCLFYLKNSKKKIFFSQTDRFFFVPALTDRRDNLLIFGFTNGIGLILILVGLFALGDRTSATAIGVMALGAFFNALGITFCVCRCIHGGISC
jgi:hypothetical protein